MKTPRTLAPLLALALLPRPWPGRPRRRARGWKIPVEARTLANGLTVVVSEDHSSPTFGLSIAYRIGFRLEPKGRTGFAHLFEHMMFEGTPTAAKGTLTRVIEGGGGVLNGSTRYDYTNYISSAPVSALDAILWLEADRMKILDFSEKNLKNQQDVVKEEIRVNVKNRPYGLFFWTDLAGRPSTSGERPRRLRQLRGPRRGARRGRGVVLRLLLRPGNAVLGVAGDVTPADVFARAERYFGGIPARPVPAPPDVSEPLNTANARSSRRTRWPGSPRSRSGQDAGPGQPGPRPGRRSSGTCSSPGRPRASTRPREGQGAAPAGPGRRQLAARRRLDLPGPDLARALRPLQADTSAKAVVDAIGAEAQRIAQQGVPPPSSPASRPR